MTGQINRRQALGGAATVGLGVPLLAACGSDDAGGTATASDSPTQASSPASSPSASPAKGPNKSAAPARGLVATADVPVGGGVVLPDEEVVVTQPTEGEFKAFSAVCTHQGCLVGDVTDTINCPCHGSRFSIENGEPTAGPATAPLGAIDIIVSGKAIELE